jgi:cytoskeletal protein RodZ
MPSRNIETDPGPDDSVSTPNGPGEGPMSAGWIFAVAIYLVLASVLVLYGLIKLWPYPTPSGEANKEAAASADTSRAPTSNSGTTAAQPAPTANAATGASNPPGGTTGAAAGTSAATTTPTNPAPASTGTAAAPARSAATPPKRELPDPENISFFGGRFNANIYLETRLLLLVMLAGSLGSLMHSLRSLYWYTGNRMMVWSWVGFYLLLPFTGAMLAVIFYFVVRGGFFSPQASFDNTSPFGFAALSALVGLFSPQATLKLKEVAETIFTKPGAGADTKPQAALTKSTTETTTSEAATETTATEGATGTDAAVDDLDGHDADLKADTPDEQLPVTEGGVE